MGKDKKKVATKKTGKWNEGESEPSKGSAPVPKSLNLNLDEGNPTPPLKQTINFDAFDIIVRTIDQQLKAYGATVSVPDEDSGRFLNVTKSPKKEKRHDKSER